MRLMSFAINLTRSRKNKEPTMRCETCRHDVASALSLRSECNSCDGYNRYQPSRDEEERLEHDREMNDEQRN